MATLFNRTKALFQRPEPRDYWVMSLILIAAALVYLISVNGPFTYDDIDQIPNNFYIRDISHISGVIFKSGRPTRLLFNLFLASAWSLAPGKTWPFHIVLIFLHLVNITLVFGLVKKVFPKDREGRSVLVWGTTLLFAFHPLQVQGISYIMGGLSSFQGFFYLSCLNFYSSEDGRNDWKIRVLLGISMLCKESCLLIPILLIWWDLTIGQCSIRSLSFRRHGFFLLSSLLVMGPLYWITLNPTAMYSSSTGFHLFPYGQYLLIQGSYYLLYIRLLFDSSMQSLIHPYPNYDPSFILTGIIGWGICAYLIGYSILSRKKNPVFSFFVGFFFISIFLTNTFLEMSNPFAEYRLYQANLSPFLGIIYILNRGICFVKRPSLKWISLGAPFLWLLWSCCLMQVVWGNEVAIYVYSLSVYPESFELTQLLGGYYESDKKWDLAEAQYLKAIPLVKKTQGLVMYHPYRVLFRIYVFSKQWDKALKEIQVIETELSGGKLPDDGYVVYLRILRKIQDRTRFDEIRKKALAFYPSKVFPTWENGAKDTQIEEKK